MAGLNVLTYLTAYLDACGRNSGKPLSGPAWNGSCPGKPHPETSKPGHSRPRPDNPAQTATATASPQTRSRRPLACPLTGLPNTYALSRHRLPWCLEHTSSLNTQIRVFNRAIRNIGQLTSIEPSPPPLPHRAGGPRLRRSSTPGCPRARRRSHPRPASAFLRAHIATKSLTRCAGTTWWADSPERSPPPCGLGPPICPNQGSRGSGPRAAGISGVNAGESLGPYRRSCRVRQQVRG